MKMYVLEFDDTSVGKFKVFLKHNYFSIMVNNHFHPFVPITEEEF